MHRSTCSGIYNVIEGIIIGDLLGNHKIAEHTSSKSAIKPEVSLIVELLDAKPGHLFKIPVGGADEVLIVPFNMSWTEFLSFQYKYLLYKLHALIESHITARAVPES